MKQNIVQLFCASDSAVTTVNFVSNVLSLKPYADPLLLQTVLETHMLVFIFLIFLPLFYRQ